MSTNPTESASNRNQFDPRYWDFLEHFESEYGFPADSIFCSITGKSLGTMSCYEVDSIIKDIPGDVEQVADDYFLRLMASLRPSLRWNKMRDDSILRLAASAPEETLAYLLNRLFARPMAMRQTMDERLIEMSDRIRTFQRITLLSDSEVSNLLHAFLELDAKWGLDSEIAPFSWESFWTCEDALARATLLNPYFEKRNKEHEKRVQQEELSSRWFRRGHSLAKPAFVASFLKQKPPVKAATQKAKAKSKDLEFMDGILSGLLGDLKKADSDTPLDSSLPKPISAKGAATPKFVRPSTKAPVWGKKV